MALGKYSNVLREGRDLPVVAVGGIVCGHHPVRQRVEMPFAEISLRVESEGGVGEGHAVEHADLVPGLVCVGHDLPVEGLIDDKILGLRRSVLYGGTLMARPIRSTGVKDRSEGHADAKPGFSSGAVMGSAFGTTTGFLVEARLPLSAPVPSPEPEADPSVTPGAGTHDSADHGENGSAGTGQTAVAGQTAEAGENHAAEAAGAERSQSVEVGESSR